MTDSAPACALLLTPTPPSWRWRDHRPGGPPPSAQPPLPSLDTPPPPAQASPPTAPAVAPVARLWAMAVVETLSGRRPLSQLEGWFSPAQRDLLGQRSAACRAAGGVRLSSWRAQSPRDGVIEVTLTLALPAQVKAGALSLVNRGDRWSCADLTLG